MVGGNTGVPVRLLRIAIRYWASYPTEIDAEIAAADRSEELANKPGSVSSGCSPDKS